MSATADRHGLVLVEDAAQVLGSRSKGRPVGSIGQLATISFHDTEGGALCTNDEAFARRTHITRDKGTNRREFLLGQADPYTWIAERDSRGELEALEKSTEQRRLRYERYVEGPESLQTRGVLTLSVIPAGTECNYHLFHVLLSERHLQAELLAFLTKQGGRRELSLHSAAQVSHGSSAWREPLQPAGHGLRMPVHREAAALSGLAADPQQRVIENVHEFFEKH